MSNTNGCNACFTLEDTRRSLGAVRAYLWEKAANVRPPLENVPRLISFYCCICCRNRNRKSIGVVAATETDKDSKTDQKSVENNNFLCGQFKRPAEANGTPVITMAVEVELQKSSQSNGMAFKQETPTSVKSMAYSQKSTASAQSSNSGEHASQTHRNESSRKPSQENPQGDTIDATFMVAVAQAAANDEVMSSEIPAKWTVNEAVLQKDNVDATPKEHSAILAVEEVDNHGDNQHNRRGSLNSLMGTTEGSKSATPAKASRAQSLKSLPREEMLDASESFVLVKAAAERRETMTSADSSSGMESTQLPKCQEHLLNKSLVAGSNSNTPRTPRPRSCHSPATDELQALSRRDSLVKSMECLYERPHTKPDSLENTTDTSSPSSSQLHSTIPIKPQHTPLKLKAKTSHVLKSKRRVSPVKRSIVTPQAENYPSTLTAFDKPREMLPKTLDQLDSSNWEVVMLGLKNMVRLMRYHAELLENQMHMVCIQLTRSVRNLRSQVARAACQAASEIFLLKSKSLEQECDDLVFALLTRTADTNRFLRADATHALDSMNDNLPPVKILHLLTSKGAVHHNAVVRTTSAKLMNRLAERLGCEKIYALPRECRDKFFVTGANLLLEGSLETRSYAKALFRLLADHQNYNRILLEVIPTRTYRNVEKTLKSITN